MGRETKKGRYLVAAKIGGEFSIYFCSADGVRLIDRHEKLPRASARSILLRHLAEHHAERFALAYPWSTADLLHWGVVRPPRPQSRPSSGIDCPERTIL